MTSPDFITAYEYSQIINAMYGKAPKKVLCERLRISRPTHDLWLQQGIRNVAQVRRIRDLVGIKVTELRSRARSLDRWTTSDVFTETKRLTFRPRGNNFSRDPII